MSGANASGGGGGITGAALAGSPDAWRYEGVALAPLSCDRFDDFERRVPEELRPGASCRSPRLSWLA